METIFYSLVIFLVSFFMSLSTILVRRRFINQKDMVEFQQEIKRWNSDRQRAMKTHDKKLLAQLKKQEKRILQMQSKTAKGQMISLFVPVALYYFMWMILSSYVVGQTVAFSPFYVPYMTSEGVAGMPPYEMPLFFWYTICFFFSSILLQRIFGISMGMGFQPQPSK
jgi:uncharacterized membrane protein (DUF106 family)